MDDIAALFPESYEASRARFRAYLDRIQAAWPGASLERQALAGDEKLTIDWIWAPANRQMAKVLVFTTGEHGVEGYVGSAMLQHFADHYLPRLDPADTGLLFVHAINPWGMQHRRRTNANNIDLNRNFLMAASELDEEFNLAYDRMLPFVHPTRPVTRYRLERIRFYLNAIWWRVRLGSEGFWGSVWLGQYRHSQGLHYGGASLQEETLLMQGLYRRAFSSYAQVLHLDMHTGYGPRYQMSLVNSAYEKRSSQDWSAKFGYPRVVAANPQEFYAIRGDMIDYVYSLWQGEFPDRRLYATSFEFGTYGDSFPAALRSRRAVVFENRAFWYGAANQHIKQQVERDFQELFYPQDRQWQQKAVADAGQAFAGILRSEGFLAEGGEL